MDVQVFGLHGNTVGGEHPYRMVQLRDRGAMSSVGCNAQVWVALQDVAREGGEVAPRTDFNEDPVATVMHAFNRLLEADGARPLDYSELADLFDVVWAHIGCCAGIQFDPWGMHTIRLEVPGNTLQGRFEPGRMVRAIERQWRDNRPLLGQ
jgi:hypothetical protein